MNIQEKFEGLANLGAGWVMWLLVALSVISLALIIERIALFVMRRDDVQTLREDLRKLYKARDFSGALARAQRSMAFEGQIVAGALEEVEAGDAAVEERIVVESKVARLEMERNLAFLGTVGNNAPFVGLLGTVIGIVRAFRELKMSQGGQVSDSLLAEIGEALIATAIGLLVALPAVAFFNTFQRMIKGRLERAQVLSGDLLVAVRSKTPGSGS